MRFLEGWLATRSRLQAQTADAQRAVDGLEADLQAARGRLDGLQAVEAAQAARVYGTDGSLQRLDRDLPQFAAAAVPVRELRRTTSVAYPPAPGHDPETEASRARQALAAGLATRAELRRQLVDLQRVLDLAREATDAARQDLAVRTAVLGSATSSLAELAQETTGDDASPAARVGHALSTEAGGPAPPSASARSDIPAAYLDLYTRAAATCPGLSWAVLAAIGAVESDHGRLGSPGVHSGSNEAGAMGPMQFVAGTWAAYRVDGDGDGSSDVYNPADAVFGAANYLCSNGAGHLSRLVDAVWDYNHADWYVAAVLAGAARYGAGDDAEVLRLVRRPA